MQPVPWRHSHPHNMRLAFYHYFFFTSFINRRESCVNDDVWKQYLARSDHLRRLTDGVCDGIFVGERSEGVLEGWLD